MFFARPLLCIAALPLFLIVAAKGFHISGQLLGFGDLPLALAAGMILELCIAVSAVVLAVTLKRLARIAAIVASLIDIVWVVSANIMTAESIPSVGHLALWLGPVLLILGLACMLREAKTTEENAVVS